MYFLRHKSDVFDKFKEYEHAVADKFGRPIKILHTNNGCEFDNLTMLGYFKEKGINFESIAP